MKRIVHLLFRMLFILSVIGAGVATYDSAATKQTAERTITDHAGRNVQIPAKVNKVFGTSPVGTIRCAGFPNLLLRMATLCSPVTSLKGGERS